VIHLLLVDDQALIRSGLRAILGADPTFRIDEATNGYDAIEQVRSGMIDLVLMDIRMPGMNGVEATRRIRSLPGPSPKIMVLTTFEADETVVEAISAGADGFIGKSVEPEELLARIHSVLGGRAELSPAAAGALVRHVAEGEDSRPRIDPRLATLAERLTPRERDIVIAVASGRTNDEIAAAEFISQFTVKTHVNRAMTKVGASDRGQLVAFAFRAGLVRD
jgi:DNA-binding NarL/FixJ family response regulator